MNPTSWIIALASGALVVVLVSLAILDRGLGSEVYAAMPLVAGYTGLMFPRRLAVISLIGTLVVTSGVQAANPGATLFDAVVIGGLIAIGWIIGALAGAAHANAALVATELINFDEPTGLLNRRGLLSQIDRLVDRTPAMDRPVALAIVTIGPPQGTSAQAVRPDDREFLAWIGQAIAAPWPADAEIGRLGGTTFGILLPGVARSEALMLSRDAWQALDGRVDVSIGVATSQTLAVATDDLLRVADAALRQGEIDRSAGPQALAAGTAWNATIKRHDPARPPTSLSYARMRSTGHLPALPRPGVLFGPLIAAALAVIALAGAYIVAGQLSRPTSGAYDWLLRHLGAPWIALVLAMAWVAATRRQHEPHGRRYWFLFVGSTLAVGFGVSIAMLAHGGLRAPIGTALCIKVMFDASIMPPATARITLAAMLGWWALVALAGPAPELWMLPFELALFGAAYHLGATAYRRYRRVALDTLRQADGNVPGARGRAHPRSSLTSS